MAAVTRGATALAAAFVAGAVVAALVGLALGLGRDDAPDRPGVADVGFSQDMAVHHEQAILMGNLALTHGRPAVRHIAESILINQSQELGLMRGWLKIWDEPATDPHPMAWMASDMPSMSGMGMSGMGMSGATMPGMASPAQLNRLYQRTGAKFDVLFLQLMIRHHLGGIQMARSAIAYAALPVVRQAAQSMVVEQVEDIGTMRALLKHAGGHELPAP